MIFHCIVLDRRNAYYLLYSVTKRDLFTSDMKENECENTRLSFIIKDTGNKWLLEWLKIVNILCHPWNVQVNRASPVAVNIKVFQESYFNQSAVSIPTKYFIYGRASGFGVSIFSQEADILWRLSDLENRGSVHYEKDQALKIRGCEVSSKLCQVLAECQRNVIPFLWSLAPSVFKIKG